MITCRLILNHDKVYDLDQCGWTELNKVEGEVPHPRLAHGAAVVGNTIYIIAGRYDGNDVNGNPSH